MYSIIVYYKFDCLNCDNYFLIIISAVLLTQMIIPIITIFISIFHKCPIVRNGLDNRMKKNTNLSRKVKYDQCQEGLGFCFILCSYVVFLEGGVGVGIAFQVLLRTPYRHCISFFLPINEKKNSIKKFHKRSYD